MVEVIEVAEEQESDSGETNDMEADDEELEEGDENSAEEESEREGRPSQSGSMSSRSESKPYSSVTHKCEVRLHVFLLHSILKTNLKKMLFFSALFVICMNKIR